MAKETFMRLNPMAAGVAGAILGLLSAIVGFFWHGMMDQPTLAGMMYRGFSYMNPAWFIIIFFGAIVCGFIAGYLFAAFYNWALKKKL